MPRTKGVTQKRSKSTGSRPSKSTQFDKGSTTLASAPSAKSTTTSATKSPHKSQSAKTQKNNQKNSKKDTHIDEKESHPIKTDAPDDESDNELEEIEYDGVDEEFFDEKNFKDFNSKIQYRIFDPEQYVSEVHREIIVVPSKYRKTSEVITKFEYTDVTSNRAKQIENGSPVFTDIHDESDPIKMAELEIRMKRCPLSIRRMISNNICEIWDVNEMIVPY